MGFCLQCAPSRSRHRARIGHQRVGPVSGRSADHSGAAQKLAGVYCQPRRKEEGPPALLLRRRERPRRPPASHRPSERSRLRRKSRRLGSRSHRSDTVVRHHARFRPARCPVVGRPANRCLRSAAATLAPAALRILLRPLLAAGRHSSHLPARSQDRGGRLVRPHRAVTALGLCGGTIHLPSLLGLFRDACPRAAVPRGQRRIGTGAVAPVRFMEAKADGQPPLAGLRHHQFFV